jgi:hypothetical protein
MTLVLLKANFSLSFCSSADSPPGVFAFRVKKEENEREKSLGNNTNSYASYDTSAVLCVESLSATMMETLTRELVQYGQDVVMRLGNRYMYRAYVGSHSNSMCRIIYDTHELLHDDIYMILHTVHCKTL